jgi:hypothetical protein
VSYRCAGVPTATWKSLEVPGQEPTVAYLGNVYLVARLSVDNLNKQCFHNITYTYIYVLRKTVVMTQLLNLLSEDVPAAPLLSHGTFVRCFITERLPRHELQFESHLQVHLDP